MSRLLSIKEHCNTTSLPLGANHSPSYNTEQTAPTSQYLTILAVLGTAWIVKVNRWTCFYRTE